MILTSCQNEITEPVPDVSAFDPKFDFNRFDQELFALDTLKLDAELRSLEDKYPAFSSLYFTNVLLMDPNERSNEVQNFLGDKRIQHIQDTTEQIIGDLDEVREELYKAFQFYLHYFPESQLPNIYTFISEYAFQSFIFQDTEGRDGIGAGLDMFLGNDYPYRNIIPNNPAFSEYLTRSFNKEHMAKKIIETLIDDRVGESTGNTLLDKMIHNGKKIYILDKIMPFVSDTVIMEYSQKQLDWCENNEEEMWVYLFSENLFYSTDLQKINKLVNPSPHSSGMPPQAPGRTANYIGWQIVKAYMNRQPQSMDQLIKQFNSQEILEASKYRGRRQ